MHSDKYSHKGPFKGKNPDKGHYDKGKKQKSLTELADEVKEKFFEEGTYDDLLALKESKRIDKVLEKLEEFTKKIGHDLTVSQLRNVYNQIVKIKKGENSMQNLKLIRPNLAYIAARLDKNENGKKVIALVDDLIKNIDSASKQDSFHKTMEALVSYHKFYGKKTND